MKTDEMVTILERIARDEDKSPTARCTAIRKLRQIEQDRARGRSDEPDDELERRPANRIAIGSYSATARASTGRSPRFQSAMRTRMSSATALADAAKSGRIEVETDLV